MAAIQRDRPSGARGAGGGRKPRVSASEPGETLARKDLSPRMGAAEDASHAISRAPIMSLLKADGLSSTSGMFSIEAWDFVSVTPFGGLRHSSRVIPRVR